MVSTNYLVLHQKHSISHQDSEFLTYIDIDCEKIEYLTKSTNVKGGISKLRILSKGFNYKQLLLFKEVISDEGVDFNIIAESKNIGKIENVRVVDIGYDYSADKTF